MTNLEDYEVGEPKSYWVPVFAGSNEPDWTRAVPEIHEKPTLRLGDMGLLLTTNVPANVREKWEGKPPEPNTT